MPKDNPYSAAVQYKVHLKPTEIGLFVMKRMERPHLDKSAELRRFIELGYAAEQAGFILDGTVLRHAGRTWDTQPNFGNQAQAESGLAGVKPAAKQQGAQTPRASKPSGGSQNHTPGEVDSAPLPTKADTSPTPASSLRGKLRGLSG